MGIVWVIEKPNSNRSSVAEMLMGNFAVRVVASLSSLQRLLSLSKGISPEVLIVNLDEDSYSVEWIESLTLYDLPDCKRLYVRSEVSDMPNNLAGLRVDVGCDEFYLSCLVSKLFNQKEKKYAQVMQYKGVRLDILNSVISFADENYEEPLPRKETLILKLLLENPGNCLTRKGLQDNVWSGNVVSPRTINSHVSRLRKRLSRSGLTIESVYGGGYILV